MQLSGQFAGASLAAQYGVIDGIDWHDPAGGGSQEGFVGIEQLFDMDTFDMDGHADFLCQIQRGFTRDAFQATRIRCVQRTVLDQEDVGAGRFGQITAGVTQYRPFLVGGVGFEQR
ncbi:hypothetical protein D3C84_1061900 [compost metagenome]